jgi:hypothetical protein
MTTSEKLRPEDVLAVRSRVSWSAIFAGATVAVAIYVLLGTFGTALGLSVAPKVTDNELKASAAIWAIVSVLVSLFLGGYIATQCTAGENKTEALVHGLVVWGVLFMALLWLTTTGVSFGFNGLIGAMNSPAARMFSDEDFRAVGITPQQIDKLRQTAQSPAVTQAAWWTVGGIVLSMLASVCGALAGSGPTLVLRRVTIRRTRTENLAGGRVLTG